MILRLEESLKDEITHLRTKVGGNFLSSNISESVEHLIVQLNFCELEETKTDLPQYGVLQIIGIYEHGKILGFRSVFYESVTEVLKKLHVVQNSTMPEYIYSPKSDNENSDCTIEILQDKETIIRIYITSGQIVKTTTFRIKHACFSEMTMTIKYDKICICGANYY